MSPTLPSQPSIMIVEEEAAVLAEVAAVLTAAGFACRCCTSGEAALAEARAAAPDFILADIHLHDRNGVELCTELRQLESLRDVPTMFLSAAQIPDIIRRSDATGSAYYLRKPFDAGVLVELIRKALWMRQVLTDRAAAEQTVGV